MRTVATPVVQLDRSMVHERVLVEIRALLEELGSVGAVPMLNAASQLDRDLGLGSLERVELLARLENAFGMRLPDRVAAEANTPEDLARAILTSTGFVGVRISKICQIQIGAAYIGDGAEATSRGKRSWSVCMRDANRSDSLPRGA